MGDCQTTASEGDEPVETAFSPGKTWQSMEGKRLSKNLKEEQEVRKPL